VWVNVDRVSRFCLPGHVRFAPKAAMRIRYGWFAEGLDSPDLIAARRLLADMGDKPFSPA
jgi:hypothetical protein